MTRRASPNHIVLSVAGLVLVCLCRLSLGATLGELIQSRSEWQYLDTGADLSGSGWATVSYDSSAWSLGEAEFGYGDGDEGTIVGFGPSASNKYITTYFRRGFMFSFDDSTEPNPPIGDLVLSMVVDDGAVVWINGVEVTRVNMPEGVIGVSTLAATSLDRPAEATAVNHSLALTNTLTGDPVLVNGVNLIGVEVHQGQRTSSDLSFDAALFSLPLPSPTPSTTNTPTPTTTVSTTVTVTPTPSPTISDTPTTTPTMSETPSTTPSMSETSSTTPTMSMTSTTTPSMSESASVTPTISTTPAPSVSNTPTPSVTVTPSPSLVAGISGNQAGLNVTAQSGFDAAEAYDNTFVALSVVSMMMGLGIASATSFVLQRRRSIKRCPCYRPGVMES